MSHSQFDFHHLILLIGANPLPNFVVADYFLNHNKQLKKIWLIHSEANKLQAGTNIQADNLEKILRKKWKEERQNQTLQFPLEKVSVADVSHAKRIRSDIESKMIGKLKDDNVHLNYTGGTKAMSAHVYWIVKDKMKNSASFSYLDARKFRLIDDDKDEVITDDLREEVAITFNELIDLHGFNPYCQKKDKKQNPQQKLKELKKSIENGKIEKGVEGWVLEDYVYEILEQNINNKSNNNLTILQNIEIKKSGWKKNFELDVIFLHGYHLTGISCTLQGQTEAKLKGFEIIQRIRQIGGDEAKAMLITSLKSRDTKDVQEELIHDTGGDKNILVLGLDDLKEKELVSKVKEFIFAKE